MATLATINFNTASSGTSWTSLLNLVYPVGSVYIQSAYSAFSLQGSSYDSGGEEFHARSNPGSFLGGTWSTLDAGVGSNSWGTTQVAGYHPLTLWRFNEVVDSCWTSHTQYVASTYQSSGSVPAYALCAAVRTA